MPSITKITVMTMACGLILSALIFKIVYDHQVDLWKKDFVHQAQKTIINLKSEVKSNERILLDILSFYDASPNVTRKAFKSYVSPILKRNSFIQALEWAPRVSAENRKKIEGQAHRDGFSNFQFTESLKPGTLVKAGVRPEYYPVYFVEPFVGNESALGFDLASESRRLRAIEGSRESGELLAADKVLLVQSQSVESDLLVFVPYYGGITHRDRKLKGFIVGVYRLKAMVNNAIDPYLEKGMNLTIFEGRKISGENKLFTKSKADADLIRYKKEITAFGKSWMVLFRGDENFQDGIKWHPPIASAGGLLLLFLLISIAFEINDSRTRHKLLSESNMQLEQLSNLDSLTGLANRRCFDENLGKELNRSSRDKTPLSLILLDVDCFKEFNDTYGHLVGDECLKQIAGVLQKTVERSHDLAARYGGEEFAVILPSTDLKGGLIIAERLRALVEDLDLTSPRASILQSITISLGLVSTAHGKKNITSKALIDQADKALYEAKKQGKNRVVRLEFSIPSMVP
jgi:diguanylate cyclase (GGDEF)-like protein